MDRVSDKKADELLDDFMASGLRSAVANLGRDFKPEPAAPWVSALRDAIDRRRLPIGIARHGSDVFVVWKLR